MSSRVPSDQVCYVHCTFCNTVLVVTVPCSNPFNIVTVRCGHCASLLSLNLGAMLQKHPVQDVQVLSLGETETAKSDNICGRVQTLVTLFSIYMTSENQILGLSQVPHLEFGSSSRCKRINKMNIVDNIHRKMLQIPSASEKRQRVPSAYNKFIKEEIRRLKTVNPEISHREAFSAAAKNWAHFPRINFGLSIDGK